MNVSTVNNLSALQRSLLGESLSSEQGWQDFGEQFAEHLGNKISYAQLRARNAPGTSDTQLAEFLVEVFAQRLLPMRMLTAELAKREYSATLLFLLQNKPK